MNLFTETNREIVPANMYWPVSKLVSERIYSLHLKTKKHVTALQPNQTNVFIRPFGSVWKPSLHYSQWLPFSSTTEAVVQKASKARFPLLKLTRVVETGLYTSYRLI